jgi:hypothetical protein
LWEKDRADTGASLDCVSTSKVKNALTSLQRQTSFPVQKQAAGKIKDILGAVSNSTIEELEPIEA